MSYAAVDAAGDQMAKQFLQNSLPPVLTDGILYDIFYISTLYVTKIYIQVNFTVKDTVCV